MSKQLSFLESKFDPRFLVEYVGKSILHDPQVALIELIANAWDAYASEVKIKWPTEKDHSFSIEDNGCGLTEAEFNQRWVVLAYDRIGTQGKWAEVPARLKLKGQSGQRRVFGRHGKGRHGGFCFSQDGYFVETRKSGRKLAFRVFIPTNGKTPIACEKITDEPCDASVSGTKIYVQKARGFQLAPADMRAEIGLRFLSDPNFHVSLNGKQISFGDIPNQNCTKYDVSIGPNQTITILKIDIKDSDRTTKQHGIAWQVQRRLVGNIDWGSLGETFMDGRKTAAKRFSFIVKADCLADCVEPDWRSFRDSEPLVKTAMTAVSGKIKSILFEASKEQRHETFTGIVKRNSSFIQNMGRHEQNIWGSTVRKIQQECPSLSDNDIESVAAILAKMEASTSKYGLLNKLHNCSVDDIDTLDQILTSWTVETARIVLDELEVRLKLIDELSKKVNNKKTDEVHELQPLFEQGLWMFGPEYEAAGFTSNKGMTTVIRDVFHKKIKGSRNRPDFVITPNGSLGFYSYPRFDQASSGVNGVGRLAIIELKKPSVALGMDEIQQCWKYVTELLDKGLVDSSTRVNCFLLGTTISKHQGQAVKYNEDTVIIQPMTYDVVLMGAQHRTHLLYDQVKSEATFLKESDDVLDEIGSALNAHTGEEQTAELPL